MTTPSTAMSLPRSTPESQGLPSSAVLDFVHAVGEAGLELHSLMLVRHGHVVAEGWWDPYRAEAPHMLYSLSKSFASTAAGLAIAEGRLSLDDSVVSFFPEDLPAEVSDNLSAMRVRHLLSMSTGSATDTTGSLSRLGGDNWVRGFLACPVEHAPGTHFVYNSGATYMVSAIVQKVTSQRLLEYLTPRLFEPLGITGATWETCPKGIDIGGWGLKVKTEDIARFGQLYLQRGLWNGTRLLSEAWVADATSSHISNGDNPNSDWSQGYGFQFWRCRDGAFGQYCVVLPEQDAVVAITSGLKNMQAVLDLLWDRLLPAFSNSPMPADTAPAFRSAPATVNPAPASRSSAVPADAGRASSSSTLPADAGRALGSSPVPTYPAAETELTKPPGTLGTTTPTGETELQPTLATLSVSPPAGEPTSPHADQVSGRTYALEQNEQGYEAIAFDFAGDRCTIHIRNSRGEHPLRCGLTGVWIKTRTPFSQSDPETIAATGAWSEPSTFAFRLCFTETPFCPTLTCRFDGDHVTIDFVPNCGFRSEPYPPITGKS